MSKANGTTERLAYSPVEAAEALGITRQNLDRLIDDGAIPSFRIGRYRRIAVDDLRRWIKSQVGKQAKPMKGDNE